jgi:hypothetical protein
MHHTTVTYLHGWLRRIGAKAWIDRLRRGVFPHPVIRMNFFVIKAWKQYIIFVVLRSLMGGVG